MEERGIMEILTDWNFWGNFEIESREREEYLRKIDSMISPKRATVIKGVRRAGKSYIVYTFIKQMIENKKIGEKNTLILNFEDPRFSRIDAKDLMKMYEVYLSKLDPDKNHIVVLDEIQNVEAWEKFVRFLIENKRIKTIVTGSSSKLLSMEYATVLSGRYLDIEVFPLSFNEFLRFKGVGIKDEVDLTAKRIKVKRYLDEYLEYGGFPEVVLEDSAKKKKELLIKYVETIATKDIIKRFEIKEIGKLSELIKLYLTNIATLQSFNKLKDVIGVSLDTVERFSNYLSIARLIFFVPKISFSLKQQILTPKKVYCIDNGLCSQYGFRFMKNVGKFMENLVGIELIRKSGEENIFYWKDYQQHEIDFVVKKDMRIEQLIQVCYGIKDEKTRKREITSLISGSKEFKCKNLLIITWGYEGEEEFERTGLKRKIRYIPLWKWLLPWA